jgi:signal transduction histidine kinase
VIALAAGAGIVALELVSQHREAKTVWAIFGPAVGWSFVGTGLYAWWRRPDSRIGLLMVALGFAWFLFTLDASNSPAVYTFAQVIGGLWGAVFLHLGISFPSGRLSDRVDRALVLAGYVIFPLAFVPALLFSGPAELNCVDCPDNVLLVRRDPGLADVLRGLGALVYLVLFVIVCVRAVRRWRGTQPFERLQLTPVYVCALLTFLLVTVARAGAGDVAWWAAFISTGLMPFAFLGGLLRSHVSHLDAELRDRLEELRASRARLVEAGDAERRRLERDLHDGAQARLVALALLLRSARTRAGADPSSKPCWPALRTSCRRASPSCASSPAASTPRCSPTVASSRRSKLSSPAPPVPVTVRADDSERLPAQVEIAAYFVVSEALANVAKYARATHATVAVEQANGHVDIEVSDDGIGGADTRRGSGLRGLADRVAALDGTSPSRARRAGERGSAPGSPRSVVCVGVASSSGRSRRNASSSLPRSRLHLGDVDVGAVRVGVGRRWLRQHEEGMRPK